MLPHNVGEKQGGKEEEKEQIKLGFGQCSKCCIEMNHDNYIKKRKNM